MTCKILLTYCMWCTNIWLCPLSSPVVWFHAAVMLLIETYRSFMAQFSSSTRKKYEIWRDIAAVLQAAGYNVNSEACDKKMRSLKQRYVINMYHCVMHVFWGWGMIWAVKIYQQTLFMLAVVLIQKDSGEGKQLGCVPQFFQISSTLHFMSLPLSHAVTWHSSHWPPKYPVW